MKQNNEWLKEYRLSFERHRIRYNLNKKSLSRSAEARRKFTLGGVPKDYAGWSLVYFLEQNSELFLNLVTLTDKFKDLCVKSGISSKLVFLPQATLHITIIEILTRSNIDYQNVIEQGVKESFAIFKDEGLLPIDFTVSDELVIAGGTAILLPVEPKHEATLYVIHSIREVLASKLRPFGKELVVREPKSFSGHITIGYVINDMNVDSYSKLKEIIQQTKLVAKLDDSIDKLELSHYTNMTSWNHSSVISLDL